MDFVEKMMQECEKQMKESKKSKESKTLRDLQEKTNQVINNFDGKCEIEWIPLSGPSYKRHT